MDCDQTWQEGWGWGWVWKKSKRTGYHGNQYVAIATNMVKRQLLRSHQPLYQYQNGQEGPGHSQTSLSQEKHAT